MQKAATSAGVVRNYRVTRGAASFVFADADQTGLGVIAVAAAIAGLSVQAASIATSSTSAEEDADYVEFDLDGQRMKGWLWRSPLEEGDEIQVVGEPRDGYTEVLAVVRTRDRIVAMYPHCSRGTIAHTRNALKWWLFGSVGFNSILLVGAVLTTSARDWDHFLALSWAFLASSVFVAVMIASLARQWMPFVRSAERVFRALNWQHPERIELVKSSKMNKHPKDPVEYGTFYFRY